MNAGGPQLLVRGLGLTPLLLLSLTQGAHGRVEIIVACAALGLLREDKALTNRFLRSHASIDSIRKQIEGHTTIREKVSTSVDLPLSHECKRVLAYAAEEAERLSHKHIGTEHLLLGLPSGDAGVAGRAD